MTQEDKELLLKDLSARLPYRVEVCNITEGREDIKGMLLSISRYVPYSVDILTDYASGKQEFSPLEDVRPYLRPMSSMTEEERKEYERFSYFSIGLAPILMDWIYSHHLDCCGLIEKGLAIEAPEDMYNIKEK